MCHPLIYSQHINLKGQQTTSPFHPTLRLMWIVVLNGWIYTVCYPHLWASSHVETDVNCCVEGVALLNLDVAVRKVSFVRVKVIYFELNILTNVYINVCLLPLYTVGTYIHTRTYMPLKLFQISNFYMNTLSRYCRQ